MSAVTVVRQLQLGRWVVSAVLSLGLAMLATGDSAAPPELAALFILLGIGGGCAWLFWCIKFRGQLSELSGGRLGDRLAVVCLLFITLLGCLAWAQRHEEREAVLKRGEDAFGEIAAKEVSYRGRTAVYTVFVNVVFNDTVRNVSLDVAAREYSDLDQGDALDLRVLRLGDSLLVASPTLATRGLSLPQWLTLFLALVSGVWGEVIGWVGRLRSSGKVR